jgi:hypothetical protein
MSLIPERPALDPLRALRLVLVSCAILVGGLVVSGAQASAAGGSAGWTLASFASPSNFSSSDNALCVSKVAEQNPPCDGYRVTATNAGSVASDGSTVTLTDTLPAGLTVQRVQFLWSGESSNDLGGSDCTTTPLRCEFAGTVLPGQTLQMTVYVTVEGAAGALTNMATVSGGGAASVSREATNEVSSATPPFGASSFGFYVDGADGLSDTQAGGHPYEVTATVGLSTDMRSRPNGDGVGPTSVQDVKDVLLDLPLGFAASALAAPECSIAELSVVGCPSDTQVGEILTEPPGDLSYTGPIWNLVPEHGVAGEFGFVNGKGSVQILYANVVPTEQGYVLQAASTDLPEIDLTSITITFFGDPAERDGTGNQQVPFLTNPTDCSAEALTATLYMDSWQNPAKLNSEDLPVNLEEPTWVKAESKSPAVTGCNSLQFPAAVEAQPIVHESDTPTGLSFELKVPQTENVGANATPALRNATVTLPEGLTLNPSAGDGLQTCSEAQIGWVGPGPASFNATVPECPEASKIGTLELETPLLPAGTKAKGDVYLASQNENPYGSVFAVYVVVDDPGTGVLVKVAGHLVANPQTGQLSAVVDEAPQLPFSALTLHLFGGPRAELITPESCGVYTTTSELAPWSGTPATTAADSFSIMPGPYGEACPDGEFHPTFQVGSTINEAGAGDSLTLFVQRADSEEQLGAIAVQAPQAVAEMFTGVPPCGEPQAASGTCSQASDIGSVQLTAGAGPNPYLFSGSVYLTGAYRGAAQGLSIVVPVDDGPFELGTVVVRATAQIDPATGQLSIASDPLPTVVDGVPLRLRTLELQFDRGEFRPNPDGCEPLAITGTLTSTRGSAEAISANPFSIVDPQGKPQECAAPPAPAVAASTASGASPGAATVSLAGTRIATTKGGKAAIELRCIGVGTCRGKLTLTVETNGKDKKTGKGRKTRSRATTIGTASFSVAGDATKTVKVELNAAGRTLLSADRGRLSASLAILELAPGAVNTQVKAVRLVEQAAKVRKS